MFMRGLLVDQSRDGIVSHRICLGSGPSLMLYAMLTKVRVGDGLYTLLLI